MGNVRTHQSFQISFEVATQSSFGREFSSESLFSLVTFAESHSWQFNKGRVIKAVENFICNFNSILLRDSPL